MGCRGSKLRVLEGLSPMEAQTNVPPYPKVFPPDQQRFSTVSDSKNDNPQSSKKGVQESATFAEARLPTLDDRDLMFALETQESLETRVHNPVKSPVVKVRFGQDCFHLELDQVQIPSSTSDIPASEPKLAHPPSSKSDLIVASSAAEESVHERKSRISEENQLLVDDVVAISDRYFDMVSQEIGKETEIKDELVDGSSSFNYKIDDASKEPTQFQDSF